MIAEEIVSKDLEKMGFTVGFVDKENSNGIDVCAISNNTALTFEVKRAVKSTRSYRVKKVGKSGKNCDYIAIVFPNNYVWYEDMKHHLALCSKDGSRSVTKIVSLLGC